MRSTWILLPVLALAGSTFAAPTPTCGWRPHIPKPFPNPGKINHRAAPVVDEASIENPLDVVTRSAPEISKALPNVARIDC